MVGRIGPSSSPMRPLAPKPRGREPDAEDREAFLRACENGHDNFITRYLKEWPGHTECYWKATERTGLLCAALNGRESTVKLLIDQGAMLGARDNEGANALMLAAQSGNESLVKFLLSRGFIATTKDKENRTAMHHFAIGGKGEENGNVPLLLLRNGADINDSSPGGMRAIDSAIMLDHMASFLTLLHLGKDFSAPQTVSAAKQAGGDYLELLEDEPARRGRETAQKLDEGLGATLKVKKPFNVSTTKVEKKPPPQPLRDLPARNLADLSSLAYRKPTGREWVA